MEAAQVEPAGLPPGLAATVMAVSAPKTAPPPFSSAQIVSKTAASAPKPFPSTASTTPHAQSSQLPTPSSNSTQGNHSKPSPSSTAPVSILQRSETTPSSAPNQKAKQDRPVASKPNPKYHRGNQGPKRSGQNHHTEEVAIRDYRRQRRLSDDQEQCKAIDPQRVLVSGYPPYSQAQDLSRVFATFGNVKVEKITNKVATLVYTTKEEAAAAIEASTKVNVYGEFLTVQPYSGQRAADLTKQLAKLDFPLSKQKSIPTDPNELDFSGDFNTQLERILAGVRLSQAEVSKLSTLYSDVERALQAQWPGCSAIPFGSITTGLGVKTSDADCFIHIPAQFRHANANYVMKAKRILLQYPDVFAEIFSIPRANTPIVKFYHIPTTTNCDLTFKTPLGAQNSKLVAFLMNADPRLVPMAVAIKYWAKVHEFSGTGKLTNYALTLLIIFYLQQPPRSLLPPVALLQRAAPRPLLVDHWDTAFVARQDILPPTTDRSPVSELLGGFFEYYSLFNFEEMAVCTYSGAPVPKDAFLSLGALPDDYLGYKTNVLTKMTLPMRSNTAICIQDPFEQCHNVASAINSRLAAEIKAYFKFAANAYDKDKGNACQTFLSTILLQKPKIIRAKSHPEYRVNLFPRIIVTIVDPDWKPIVREIIFTIFEKMMKIKLGKVEEKVNLDTRKEKEKYMGVVTKPIWKRKHIARYFNSSDLPFDEKQEQITEKVMKVEEDVAEMQFQLSLTYCAAPRSAVLGVRLSAGDLAVFRDFGKFFISVTQGWFLSLLRPYAREPDRDTAAKIADTIHILEHTALADADRADDADTADADAGADAPAPAPV